MKIILDEAIRRMIAAVGVKNQAFAMQEGAEAELVAEDFRKDLDALSTIIEACKK